MDAIVILSESRPLFSSAPDGLDDRTGDLTRVADQIDWTIISNRIFRHALSEGGRREHHVRPPAWRMDAAPREPSSKEPDKITPMMRVPPCIATERLTENESSDFSCCGMMVVAKQSS